MVRSQAPKIGRAGDLSRFSHCENGLYSIFFCAAWCINPVWAYLVQNPANRHPGIFTFLHDVHACLVDWGLCSLFAFRFLFVFLCKEAFSHGVEQCIAQDAGGAGFIIARHLNVDVYGVDMDHGVLSFALK